MQAQAKHLSFVRIGSVALETVRWAGWSSVQFTVQCRYVRTMMARLREQMKYVPYKSVYTYIRATAVQSHVVSIGWDCNAYRQRNRFCTC